MTHGSYFINKFYEEGPQTLNKLKELISNGDTEWINRITYFSKSVPGSAAYWRHKRRQVFSWVNFHIKEKHGPPNLFMAFSCAEYKWPDVRRLLKERLVLAGGLPGDFDSNYTKYVNQYTILVQEYFQLRLSYWLETVGRSIFSIDHYWLGYEFAPSRCQIHAHMLAIMDLSKVENLMSNIPANDSDEKAKLYAMWVEQCFKMTACIDENILEVVDKTRANEIYKHPSSRNYSETSQNNAIDEVDLLDSVQKHICSKYCLKKKR